MSTTFGALGVPDDLATRLAAVGISEPFAIQAAVIPDALAGRDVTGRAPTGSGKTLAFGIPLVVNLRPAQRRRPTALVLAPTRELAEQIAAELRPLARARRHDVVSVYGGVGYGAQRKALDNGAELVVACPGRLEDLLSMRALSLQDVTQVVVDEADRMSDMGFLPAVRRILDQTAATRQVLLFSATLDGAVGKLAAAVQRRPVRHEVGEQGPDMTLTRHAFWSVDRADRPALTADVVRQLGSTMVFCRTRHGADRLARQLDKLGVKAAPIHGGRSQPQRDRALKDFQTGAVVALVATDVAARGVHVDDVQAVVHFDPPEDSSTYVHRSGRTARAGASGVVVSMIEPGTERDAKKLQRDIRVDVGIGRPNVRDLACRESRSAPPTRDTRSLVRDPSTPSNRSRDDRRPLRVQHAPAVPLRDTPSLRRDASTRKQGTVAFFHVRRGYGFISGGDGADVFVHQSNTGTPIATGQRVEFAVRDGQKGLEAYDVVAV